MLFGYTVVVAFRMLVWCIVVVVGFCFPGVGLVYCGDV